MTAMLKSDTLNGVKLKKENWVKIIFIKTLIFKFH